MAARFEALDELFDDALELPVGSRMYRIPSPPAEDGLRVERITSMAAQLMAGGQAPQTTVLDDDEEIDLYRLCLGPVYDELLADAVSWALLKHIALTAMFWITSDAETARKYWASAGNPEAMAPNRAARRQQQKRGSAESAAAKSIPRRGSTSGTKAGSPRRKRTGRA